MMQKGEPRTVVCIDINGVLFEKLFKNSRLPDSLASYLETSAELLTKIIRQNIIRNTVVQVNILVKDEYD